MADPFTGTMAAVSAGTSLLGGITSAFGQSQASSAQAQQFQYKAALARRNAAIAKENSARTLEAGDYNAMREGLTTAFTIAKQKTGQAASGFDVNEGTPADVRASTAKLGLADQDRIRLEAGRKAQGYRQQGDQELADASMYDQAAANARKAGKISVFSTLLGTAGSVAGKWTQASSAFGKTGSGITTYGSDFQPTGYFAT